MSRQRVTIPPDLTRDPCADPLCGLRVAPGDDGAYDLRLTMPGGAVERWVFCSAPCIQQWFYLLYVKARAAGERGVRP